MGGGLLPRYRSEAGHPRRAAAGTTRSHRYTRRRPSEGDPHLAPGFEDLEAWEPNEGAGRPPLPVAQGDGQGVAGRQRHRAGESPGRIDGNRETANARGSFAAVDVVEPCSLDFGALAVDLDAPIELATLGRRVARHGARLPEREHDQPRAGDPLALGQVPDGRL